MLASSYTSTRLCPIKTDNVDNKYEDYGEINYTEQNDIVWVCGIEWKIIKGIKPLLLSIVILRTNRNIDARDVWIFLFLQTNILGLLFF